MPRPKDRPPPSTDHRVRRLSELASHLEKLTEERDRVLLDLIGDYGVRATAVRLGIAEAVLYKRVSRIRHAIGAVQQHDAA